jgi:TonB family protein
MRISFLKAALLASLAVHAVIALVLLRKHTVAAHAKKGVVSVDFIQAVHHGAPAPEVVARHPHEKKSEARKESPRAEPPSSAPPTSNSVKGPVGDPAGAVQASNLYVARVMELINRSKIYPRAAVDREEEGKVVVAVTLVRDGGVADVKVEEPSPFELLNEAALQTVRTIRRFPPLPPEVEEPMHLHIPLVYTIQR